MIIERNACDTSCIYPRSQSALSFFFFSCQAFDARVGAGHCSLAFAKFWRKVAAVFRQRGVLRFTAGLPAGYPFCRVCGVVSFVSGIRVIGLGPFPF